MLGILKYINDFTEREIETLHVEPYDDVLYIFFNCKDTSIEDILATKVAPDFAELSFGQNLFDNLLMPHEVDLDL